MACGPRVAHAARLRCPHGRHVEQLPCDGPSQDAWSRVYFSSDALTPPWLSWARDGLARQAAYKNLYWVDAYANEAMGRGHASRPARILMRGALIGGGAVAGWRFGEWWQQRQRETVTAGPEKKRGWPWVMG